MILTATAARSAASCRYKKLWKKMLGPGRKRTVDISDPVLALIIFFLSALLAVVYLIVGYAALAVFT